MVIKIFEIVFPFFIAILACLTHIHLNGTSAWCWKVQLKMVYPILSLYEEYIYLMQVQMTARLLLL